MLSLPVWIQRQKTACRDGWTKAKCLNHRRPRLGLAINNGLARENPPSDVATIHKRHARYRLSRLRQDITIRTRWLRHISSIRKPSAPRGPPRIQSTGYRAHLYLRVLRYPVDREAGLFRCSHLIPFLPNPPPDSAQPKPSYTARKQRDRE